MRTRGGRGPTSGFDEALNAFNSALNNYLNGDPAPVLAVFSRQDDVTLCNPVGPPCRGRDVVERAVAEPSSHLTDGKVTGFDEISRFVTADLGCVVRIERGQAHLDGSAEPAPYSLRVTMIFRHVGETWKIAHRHAGPITSPRPLASAMGQPA